MFAIGHAQLLLHSHACSYYNETPLEDHGCTLIKGPKSHFKYSMHTATNFNVAKELTHTHNSSIFRMCTVVCQGVSTILKAKLISVTPHIIQQNWSSALTKESVATSSRA